MVRFPARPPLIRTASHLVVPTITVALDTKWYRLFLLLPDLDSRGEHRVVELEFPDPPEFKGTPYVDHVPNPRCVLFFARVYGYVIDDLAWELMIGRWELIEGTPQHRSAGDAWQFVDAQRAEHEEQVFEVWRRR